MKCFFIHSIKLSFFVVVLFTSLPLTLLAETNQVPPVTGESPGETHVIDAEILEFLEKHEVPGMSVAMTVNGELKYARGFGYANVEKQVPVLPTSLFRIASLSKPVTAVAVLKLVEQNKISLDDKVLDILNQYEKQIRLANGRFDPRFKAVTIRQLLQHRGGWDRSASFDPMFQSVRFAKQLRIPAPANSEDVIAAMFSHPLDFEPGEKYAYSNFGYCLLGRVIEKVSGQSYEEYVQKNVLKPLGISMMRIGKTLPEDRMENEVCYYHKKTAKSVFAKNLAESVPSPYGGWYLEAMDSHGGWIASAVDLARFASAFDDANRCPILTQKSIEEMFARPPGEAEFDNQQQPKPVYYALGWSVRRLANGKSNQWHTGSLPGTTAIMIRRHDGKNFIALLNTRDTPTSDSISGDLDQLLHRAANKVTNWPHEDLFEHDVKD